jgi:hypothetical protein
VLQILKDNKLAKLSKCDFFTNQVEYWGHFLSADGIRVDPSKTKVIAEWPVLWTKTEVCSFLGLASYYCKFIHDFSNIAAPLSALTHNDVLEPVLWGLTQQRAFDRLKHALTHALCLCTYNPNLKCTVVVTNASTLHEAIGAALMQDDSAGNRPVAYFSHKMNAAERNYTTHKQELLAIKEALRKWRHYLLGIPFDICYDHESLRFLNSQSELSGKLLCWNDFISMFNFGDVKYIKGMNNPVGDALSCPPLRPLQINVIDNKGELHSLVTLCDMHIASPTNNICELIQKDLLADKEFGQIYGLLTNPKYNQTTSKLCLHFSVKNKLLYWMYKLGTEPQLMCA